MATVHGARRPQVAMHAKRRALDRSYPYIEVYQVVVEKLRERNCLLVQDMYQLIECIRAPEQVWGDNWPLCS
jgi:hypothetical protein